MGIPKITGFLIAILVFGSLAGLFGYFLSSGSQYYDNQEYNSSLEVYNKMENIRNTTGQIQTRAEGINQTSELDILGDMFSNSYNTLKVSGQGLDLFNEMANEAAENEHISESSQFLMPLAVGTVAILFFIGIIVAVLVRRDRL